MEIVSKYLQAHILSFIDYQQSLYRYILEKRECDNILLLSLVNKLWFEIVQQNTSKTLTYSLAPDAISVVDSSSQDYDEEEEQEDQQLLHNVITRYAFIYGLARFTSNKNIVSFDKTQNLIINEISVPFKPLGKYTSLFRDFKSLQQVTLLCNLEDYYDHQQSITESINILTNLHGIPPKIEVILLLQALEVEDLRIDTNRIQFTLPVKRVVLQNGASDPEASVCAGLVQRIRPTELEIDLIGSMENREEHYCYDKFFGVDILSSVTVLKDHIEFIDLNIALSPLSKITSLSCNILSHMYWYKDGLPDETVPCINTLHSLRSLSTIESDISTFCDLLRRNTTLTDLTLDDLCYKGHQVEGIHSPCPPLEECFKDLLLVNDNIKHLGVSGDFISKEFFQSLAVNRKLLTLRVGFVNIDKNYHGVGNEELFGYLLTSLEMNRSICELELKGYEPSQKQLKRLGKIGLNNNIIIKLDVKNKKITF